MAGPPDSDLDDVARIRRVLARELETINEYEAFARASSHPEVRAFFLHLAAEEKEHVSEAVHMLRMLDAGQDTHFAAPFVPGHFQVAQQGAAHAAPEPPAPPAAPPVVSFRNGRPAASEPPTQVPPQRLMYGLPAPPPAVESHPLTVGSLRRGGGGGGSGGGGR